MRDNKIRHVIRLIGYPQVKVVILDKNPIEAIEPGTFRDSQALKSLSICKIKLPNYTDDLKFLRACPKLEDLTMNSCFVQNDLADVSGFPDLFNMKRFEMRDVGLIRTTDLHFKMPVLEVLDL